MEGLNGRDHLGNKETDRRTKLKWIKEKRREGVHCIVLAQSRNYSGFLRKLTNFRLS
jgi:hypothetical protein